MIGYRLFGIDIKQSGLFVYKEPNHMNMQTNHYNALSFFSRLTKLVITSLLLARMYR